MANQNGFFAVDKERFSMATQLGLNEAVSYLVIASGTQKDNTTSSWSINAIEKYTGISRKRAKIAVQNLIDNAVIKIINTSKTKPRYLVKEKRNTKRLESETVVWLPNGIVQSVSDEVPPIELIRQTKDVMVLVMFFDFYDAQNLVDDCGIPRDILEDVYERVLVGEYAQYKLYGFNSKHKSINRCSLTNRHIDKNPLPETRDTQPFWDRLEMLQRMGLIEMVPHLYDSDDSLGEPVHPIDYKIKSLGHYCTRAALEKIYDSEDDSRIDDNCNYHLLIPVPMNQPSAAVVGMYQLKYKAKTMLTGKWFAESSKAQKTVEERFQKLLNDLNGTRVNFDKVA